jgi:hypothetical protein
MLTMLSTSVDLDLVAVAPPGVPNHHENGHAALDRDQQRAVQLGRKLKILASDPQTGPDIVRAAREGNYNVIVLPWSEEKRTSSGPAEFDWVHYVLQNAPCSVFLASHPVIPKELVSQGIIAG